MSSTSSKKCLPCHYSWVSYLLNKLLCISEPSCTTRSIHNTSLVNSGGSDVEMFLHRVQQLKSFICKTRMAAGIQNCIHGVRIWSHSSLLHLMKQIECFLSFALQSMS